MKLARFPHPIATAAAVLLALAGAGSAGGFPVSALHQQPPVQQAATPVQQPPAELPAPSPHPDPGKPAPVPGLYGVLNFTNVDATFACGGAPSERSMGALKEAGFATVVNVRAEGERGANVEAEADAARAAGLRYVHLPFVTASPDPATVDEFLRVVSDPANQPVLLHCATGVRASVLWAIKRVVLDGWSVERAMGELPLAARASDSLEAFVLEYVKEHAKRR